MGKINWTEEQQKVIGLRDRNILVSAAAGSGKTAVLVERILQMLQDKKNPVDIDRMLIVTFTNAAASEMKEKIGRAIENSLQQHPDDTHLQKQSALLHNARIMTIHSFCKEVIQTYFNQIDLDPAFRIGDETELKLLKADVAGDLLEVCYENREHGFLELVECYGTGKSDKNIEELILNLYDFSTSYPWPEKWLDNVHASFTYETIQEMEKSPWMEQLLEFLHCTVRDCIQQNEKALEICMSFGGPWQYEKALQDDRDFLCGLENEESYSGFAGRLEALSWTRLSAKKDESVEEDKKNLVKHMREEWKKAVGDIKKNYFFQPVEEMFEDLKRTEKVMGTLVRLVKEFSNAYWKRKSKKNVLDFNDLEHLALKILVDEDGNPTDAANELSGYYTEILIDEYQDSNLVQETILKSVSKEKKGHPNIFMVGDVKQSIYKFRQARPELFLEKYRTYSKEDSLYQKVDLHKNFRSRKQVLGFVNFLFRKIMREEIGGIDYGENEKLNPGMEFPSYENESVFDTELLLVTEEKSEEDGLEKEEREYTQRELEAKAIAGEIKKMISEDSTVKIFDKEENIYRTPRFEDIVILLRTMSGWSEVFTDILEQEGIPAFAEKQSGYFSAQEVRVVLNLLRIIDNPRQDIPLACVLYSSIYHFADEELAEMKSCCRQREWYDILTDYAQNGENTGIRQKVNDFLADLREYRELAGYVSIRDLIRHILDHTGYLQYVLAMQGGEKKEGNLLMLMQKAEDFESTSYHGLFQFNRYMERLHKYEIDFGEAGINGENEDTVRIMSIHKSKGLEFPVVFVSGLGKKFNKQDTRNAVIIHPDLGLGPDFIDPVLRIKSPTLQKKVIQKQMILESMAEELRVLYVALTRAKEKLFLTGLVKNPEKQLEKWRMAEAGEEKLRYIWMAGAESFLDFIIPAVLGHPSFYSILEEYGITAGECACSGQSLPFSVSFIKIQSLVMKETYRQIKGVLKKEQLLNWDSDTVYNEEVRRQLRERLEYIYPYEKEYDICAKVSVSELKRLGQEEKEEPAVFVLEENREEEEPAEIIPKFISGEEKIKAVDLGILYHKVMEEIRLETAAEIKDVEEELKKMERAKKITPAERKAVNIKQIVQLLKSSLAGRMKEAAGKGKLYREQPFVLGLKANEVNKNYNSEELVLVQGVIDVYFEEEDGIVLMDYKTDFIKKAEDGEKMLRERYHLQLDYYQKALENASGKKVKEKWIYSFGLGRAIAV